MLVERGLLAKEEGSLGVMRVTPEGRAWLRGGQSLEIEVRADDSSPQQARRTDESAGRRKESGAADYDQALFEKLARRRAGSAGVRRVRRRGATRPRCRQTHDARRDAASLGRGPGQAAKIRFSRRSGSMTRGTLRRRTRGAKRKRARCGSKEIGVNAYAGAWLWTRSLKPPLRVPVLVRRYAASRGVCRGQHSPTPDRDGLRRPAKLQSWLLTRRAVSRGDPGV